MSERLCGTFAVWASCWLHGRSAFDDVLEVAGIHGARVIDHTRDASRDNVGDVLADWRRSGADSARAVFPVPGDVRGVPATVEFRAAALDVGAAVFGATIGLVPARLAPTPSSAGELIVWHAYDVEAPTPDHIQVSEAAQELGDAVLACASALSLAGVSGWVGDVREDISDARRAGERLHLPAGYPPDAVLLAAQAERLALVLDLAGSNRVTIIDRQGEATRAAALRPLVLAVRQARLAAYNAVMPEG